LRVLTVAIRGFPSIRHNSPQLPPPSSLAISTLPGSRRSSGLTLRPSVDRPYLSYSSLEAFNFFFCGIFSFFVAFNLFFCNCTKTLHNTYVFLFFGYRIFFIFILLWILFNFFFPFIFFFKKYFDFLIWSYISILTVIHICLPSPIICCFTWCFRRFSTYWYNFILFT